MICALGLPSKSMVLGEPPSVTPFAASSTCYPCRVIPAGVCFFCPDLVSFEFTTPPSGGFSFRLPYKRMSHDGTFATFRTGLTMSVDRARPEVALKCGQVACGPTADISSFNLAAEPRSKRSSSERLSPLLRLLSAIYDECPRLPGDASWR
jgi:hypothetical protein